jgi:hypothetical protein
MPVGFAGFLCWTISASVSLIEAGMLSAEMVTRLFKVS